MGDVLNIQKVLTNIRS